MRLLVALLLAASLAPIAQAQEQWTIHAMGLGPFMIGMPIEQVPQSTGISVKPVGELPVPDQRGNACSYYSLDLPTQEVRVRVMNGRIDRVEVSSPGFPTVRGIRVGDPIASVSRAYRSRVSVEPDHYRWDRGFVHIVVGPFKVDDESYAVAFIGSEATGVTEIWSSRYKNIRESEGCA